MADNIWTKLYSRINWKNRPSRNTPINETNLGKIDYALDEIDNRVIRLYGLNNELKSDLDDNISIININNSFITNIDNKYVNSFNGVVTDSTDYCCTDFIDVRNRLSNNISFRCHFLGELDLPYMIPQKHLFVESA